MTSSVSGTDKDMGASSSLLDSGAQSQAYRGSTVAGSGGSQNHPMYAGPGGPTGGVAMSATGAAPPMRAHYHPSQQLSRYSSHPSLSMSPTPASGPASYSPQQQPAILLPLRNNKSQSGMSSTTATNPLVQATNAILNPLSLQELALLLAYLLSVAPEQWIPWHLYDFFIRPQGRKYKDLIEMLPTHSQRILKALLETVEALVEYATGVAVLQKRKALQYQLQYQQQPQQQSGKQQQQTSLAHLRSRSEVDPGHSRNNGGYGVGGNSALKPSGSSTLSLARALAILEPPFSAHELHQIQQQQQQKASLNAGDMVHQEIALRGRKRRVILDSLSGLVFRSRQNETHRASGAGSGSVGTMGALIESPTDNGSGGLLAPEEKGAVGGGKGKAMRRRSFLGAATSTSTGSAAATTAAPSPAAVALQLQISEREIEAGHLAFDNLVSAFEAEYVRPYPSALATIGAAGASSGASTHVKTTPSAGMEVGIESQDELPNVTLPQSLVDAGSVARIRSSNTPPGSQGAIDRSAAALPPTGLPPIQQQQQLPPRQARSLPTAVSTPLGTDLAAVRSLSLPPWRKKHHSALQLGQQLSPSLSTTMARQQEWLLQYPFQPQVQLQSSQPQPSQWSSLPVLAPASRSASAPSIIAPVLNRVLTTSTNGAVASQSEELPENVQSLVPPPVSASGSTITLPALTTAEVLASPIVAGDDAVVSEDHLDVGADVEVTVTVRIRGSPEAVTTMSATLPSQTTSRRSSTKKKRPMSLDNSDNNSSVQLLRTRTLSGTISSTWTAWKDHLLVLEEEEYVLADSSESFSIISSSSSSGYSDSEDEGGEEGGERGGHDNEHDADDNTTRDFDTRRRQQQVRRRRRKDGKETVTPAVGGGAEGGRRTNKSSGTFGDLRALAAAIAASQQQQQSAAGVTNSNNNASGSSGGVV
ncbi:hypothetical protein EC991_005396 [Linnemannia zychae]|nr:hypothetical protein EC991_005396 [Linnemannia zychae]